MSVAFRHYFAYGSNMNPMRVRARGIRFVRARAARLAGFELRFDKIATKLAGAAHANIAYAPARTVEGVLYELESADEIVKMDAFERAPVNYSRELIRVDVFGGLGGMSAARGGGHLSGLEASADSSVDDSWAWTYFANSALRREGLRPPKSYMRHLLAGAAYLSAEYLEWLASIECFDSDAVRRADYEAARAARLPGVPAARD